MAGLDLQGTLEITNGLLQVAVHFALLGSDVLLRGAAFVVAHRLLGDGRGFR